MTVELKRVGAVGFLELLTKRYLDESLVASASSLLQPRAHVYRSLCRFHLCLLPQSPRLLIRER